MSKQALTSVVQRSISDAAFRKQLATDAPGALRGYDLTPDESNALRSRDAAKLTAYGVDQRMSKVFLDPGLGGSSATLTGGEPRDVAPVWIGDNSQAAQAETSGSEPRDVAPVWIGDGSQPLAAHTYSGDDNAGPDGALSGGNEPRDVAPTWIGDGSATGTGMATDEGQLTNDGGDGSHINITSGDGDRDQ